MIDFNRPYSTGKEETYIIDAVRNKKLSGNGKYTKLCQSLFEERYNVQKVLLTTSCTDALEMSAILTNIKEGDEVIVPSYTFVSSALAFIRERATIVFADSQPNHPNIDASKIESLISPKTKAIVVVHYAGIACEMDEIMALAKKYKLCVIEDAAQAINSLYKTQYLGTIGDLGAFSFHETKNIQCGEGGLITINNKKFENRAEIIWEKGTNRAEFFRGEVNKYGWVDTGSSFLPSEISSAYLFAQLENIDLIQSKRIELWERYNSNLKEASQLFNFNLPKTPDYATNNAHMFYIIVENIETRSQLISFLKEQNIHAVFHYLALHNSDYYSNLKSQKEIDLPNAVKFENQLLRLPLYFDLKIEDVDFICNQIKAFYTK